jgi:hypothetical protein
VTCSSPIDARYSQPENYIGIIVQPTHKEDLSELLYAEVEPSYSRWLPWPGRTSRWWYEVHSQGEPDEHGIGGTTYAYIKGGSGGGFTLRACLRRAQTAVDFFANEYVSSPFIEESRPRMKHS